MQSDDCETVFSIADLTLLRDNLGDNCSQVYGRLGDKTFGRQTFERQKCSVTPRTAAERGSYK